jgi:hypothetical protein
MFLFAPCSVPIRDSHPKSLKRLYLLVFPLGTRRAYRLNSWPAFRRLLISKGFCMVTKKTLDTADQVRLLLASFTAHVEELLQAQNGPVAVRPLRTAAPAPPPKKIGDHMAMMRAAKAAKSSRANANDGWNVRKFKTDRKRIPASLTPRLREVLRFLIDAKKPVADTLIAKEFGINMVATRAALWRLRKSHLVEMLP